MTRNPTWSRDELILALDLYMRHREQLPDSDAPEIVELSQALNSLFGETARDAAKGEAGAASITTPRCASLPTDFWSPRGR